MDEQHSNIVKKLRSGFFRMIIFGKTKSGKTYLLLNKILPPLKRIYDDVFIFTQPFNEKYYMRMFQKLNMGIPHIHTNEDNMLNIIHNIRQLQEKNIKGYDKDGEVIYRSNLLFIFDDILDETMFKNKIFVQIFTNLRHLQVSTILLSQITCKAINTSLKANTDFIVIFKMNGIHQRRFCIDIISEAVSNADINLPETKVKEKAKQIYRERCLKKQYGYIVIDDDANMY